MLPEYVYKPPAEVQKRQFCTMAKTFGFENAVSFALVVEGWTQEERRNCLDRFYALRRRELARGTGGEGGGGSSSGKEAQGKKNVIEDGVEVKGKDVTKEMKSEPEKKKRDEGWDDSW